MLLITDLLPKFLINDGCMTGYHDGLEVLIIADYISG